MNFNFIKREKETWFCDLVISSSNKEDLTNGQVPEVIVKCKNEIGSTNSEPIIGATCYYLYFVYNYLTNNFRIPSQNPTFILVITGRSIFLYGAITIGYPNLKKGRFIIDLIDCIYLDQDIFNNSMRTSKFFYRFVTSVELLKNRRTKINNDNKNSLFIPQPILDQQGVISTMVV